MGAMTGRNQMLIFSLPEGYRI